MQTESKADPANSAKTKAEREAVAAAVAVTVRRLEVRAKHALVAAKAGVKAVAMKEAKAEVEKATASHMGALQSALNDARSQFERQQRVNASLSRKVDSLEKKLKKKEQTKALTLNDRDVMRGTIENLSQSEKARHSLQSSLASAEIQLKAQLKENKALQDRIQLLEQQLRQAKQVNATQKTDMSKLRKELRSVVDREAKLIIGISDQTKATPTKTTTSKSKPAPTSEPAPTPPTPPTVGAGAGAEKDGGLEKLRAQLAGLQQLVDKFKTRVATQTALTHEIRAQLDVSHIAKCTEEEVYNKERARAEIFFANQKMDFCTPACVAHITENEYRRTHLPPTKRQRATGKQHIPRGGVTATPTASFDGKDNVAFLQEQMELMMHNLGDAEASESAIQHLLDNVIPSNTGINAVLVNTLNTYVRLGISLVRAPLIGHVLNARQKQQATIRVWMDVAVVLMMIGNAHQPNLFGEGEVNRISRAAPAMFADLASEEEIPSGAQIRYAVYLALLWMWFPHMDDVKRNGIAPLTEHPHQEEMGMWLHWGDIESVSALMRVVISTTAIGSNLKPMRDVHAGMLTGRAVMMCRRQLAITIHAQCDLAKTIFNDLVKSGHRCNSCLDRIHMARSYAGAGAGSGSASCSKRLKGKARNKLKERARMSKTGVATEDAIELCMACSVHALNDPSTDICTTIDRIVGDVRAVLTQKDGSAVITDAKIPPALLQFPHGIRALQYGIIAFASPLDLQVMDIAGISQVDEPIVTEIMAGTPWEKEFVHQIDRADGTQEYKECLFIPALFVMFSHHSERRVGDLAQEVLETNLPKMMLKNNLGDEANLLSKTMLVRLRVACNNLFAGKDAGRMAESVFSGLMDIAFRNVLMDLNGDSRLKTVTSAILDSIRKMRFNISMTPVNRGDSATIDRTATPTPPPSMSEADTETDSDTSEGGDGDTVTSASERASE